MSTLAKSVARMPETIDGPAVKAASPIGAALDLLAEMPASDGECAAVGEDRMTPITVTCWPYQATRTPKSACVWIAEATVDGRVYIARSRHGAPNELARQLVAAGVADRPMVIHRRGLAGTMTYRSFHAAASWTYSEGDRPLHRLRYKERPEGLFLVSGDGENAFHRSPDDFVVIPGPDPLKTKRRRCVSCDVDFLPARPWSRFCSPACRLRAHRRLAGETAARKSDAIPAGGPP